MAQTSLNVYLDLSQETKDNLKEIIGGVVENIQATAVSEALKNKRGSGDPEAGVVHYKRFKNATLQAKGTARAAGKGNPVEDADVPVNLNDDREIIEELQMKDVKLLGVDGMAEKRKANFAKRIIAYLDRKFFSIAKTAGTAYDGSSTTFKAIVDDMIVTAKETSSDYIDGIDAEDLAIVLSGKARKSMKNELDELPNGTAAANGAIGVYDSIEVYESNRMPTGTHVMVMLKEAIAEPWYLSDYAAEKVPFDDAIALETFLYCGGEALNPEAVYYYAEEASV